MKRLMKRSVAANTIEAYAQCVCAIDPCSCNCTCSCSCPNGYGSQDISNNTVRNSSQNSSKYVAQERNSLSSASRYY